MSLFSELKIDHLMLDVSEIQNLARFEDHDHNIDVVENAAISDESRHSVEKMAPTYEKIRGIFYKIFSSNGDLVGHLLGTSHFADREMLKFNSTIRDAIKRSSHIYLESIEDELESDEVIDDTEKILSQDEIERLQAYLNRSIKAFLKIMAALRVSDAFIDTQKNRFQNSSLRTQLDLVDSLRNKLGLFLSDIVFFKDSDELEKPSFGIEMMLNVYSLEYDKELGGLENVTEIREKLIQDLVNPTLKSRVQRIPSLSEITEEFILKDLYLLKETNKFWKEGNKSAFVSSWSNVYSKFDVKTYQGLFNDRDELFSNKIHEILQLNTSVKSQEKETVATKNLPLFAIGASHVIREGSNVVQLLREKGWLVKRV